MAKRKILFRIANLKGGGAEKVLTTILKKLDRDKFEIDLLLHQLAGIYLKDLPHDVGLYYLGKGEAHLGDSWLPKIIERKIEKKKYKWLKANTRYIYSHKLKKEYDVEVAFLHDLMPTIKTSPTKKKVAWVHNDFSNENYLTEKIKKDIIEASDSFDKTVCVSLQSKESFENYGADSSKTLLIYNPIDDKEILAKSELETIELDSNMVNLLAMGRLHPQKRYDRMIEAVEILVKKGIVNFHLNILGEGNEKEKLSEMIRSKNLESLITLRGFIANPYPWIKASDVFVMSSDFEGFPVVVCENLILNKPIVSTRVSGTIEVIDKHGFGFITEKTPNDLAEKLGEMILNAALREKFKLKIQSTELPFEENQSMKEINKLLFEI